mgnify:CR=1 FL=1
MAIFDRAKTLGAKLIMYTNDKINSGVINH